MNIKKTMNIKKKMNIKKNEYQKKKKNEYKKIYISKQKKNGQSYMQSELDIAQRQMQSKPDMVRARCG